VLPRWSAGGGSHIGCGRGTHGPAVSVALSRPAFNVIRNSASPSGSAKIRGGVAGAGRDECRTRWGSRRGWPDQHKWRTAMLEHLPSDAAHDRPSQASTPVRRHEHDRCVGAWCRLGDACGGCTEACLGVHWQARPLCAYGARRSIQIVTGEFPWPCPPAGPGTRSFDRTHRARRQ
jgi:hypothetical protein